MTPPVLEEVVGEKAVEVLSGRKRNSGSIGQFGQTLLIMAAVIASQWWTTSRLVEKVLDQNTTEQKANRETLEKLASQLARTEQSQRDLSETIRAAFFVSRGADAPAQHQARR